MKFNFFKKIWGKKENNEKKESQKNEESKEIKVSQAEETTVLPLITEKTMKLSEQGKYVFLVNAKVNKIKIQKTIEKIFNVKVKKVRVINYQKRTRGRSKLKSVRPKFKKAIIDLKEGQKIPLFE